MQNEFTRFENKVNKEGDCWLWTGTTYRRGYGHFRRKIGDKWVMYKAHRYSYEYHNGQIPIGSIIRHTCDNPKCVNPSHLLVGTHKDNSQDMMSRGRKGYGVNPNHKPHQELYKEIRLYRANNPLATGVEIANIFSTNTAQVSRILNNKIWNIPEEL